MLRPLTIAAGLLAASATHAFLIPPQLSQTDIADAFELIAPEISETQVVKVDCPGCPVVFKGKHGNAKVKTDKSNHLELSFTVEHGASSDRLLLNGFELYPSPDPFHEILTAPQVLDKRHKTAKRHVKHEDDENKRRRHGSPLPQPLGFGLQVSPAVKDADTQLELVTLDLQIIEVGPIFVDDIPQVRVKLIKHAGGRLMIGSIETIEAPTPAFEAEPPVKVEDCTSFVCKWINAAKEHMRKLTSGRPCHKAHGAARPEGHERPAVEMEHGHGHGYAHGHGHGQWASQGRSWGQLFKSVASHILLPVLIGIVAGVAASLIGMVVGTLVVSLWRTFFRRRSHGHRRRHSRSSKKETAVAEEKASLVEHQDPLDPPPVYEDNVDSDAKKVDV